MGGGRIDRKSSIETEPRTLNFKQIDIAREAALYVVHTRSREEARQIFTEGLEPADNIGVEIIPMIARFGKYSEEERGLYSCARPAFSRRGSIKDIATAPF